VSSHANLLKLLHKFPLLLEFSFIHKTVVLSLYLTLRFLYTIMDEYFDYQDNETEEEKAITFRDVLVNAIKMQALYSNGKIKYIETSSRTN